MIHNKSIKKLGFLFIALSILMTFSERANSKDRITLDIQADGTDEVYIQNCKLYHRLPGYFTAIAPMKGLTCRILEFKSLEYYDHSCSLDGNYDSTRKWVQQIDEGSRNPGSRSNIGWGTKSRAAADYAKNAIESHARKFCSGRDGELAAQTVRAAVALAQGGGSSRSSSAESCNRHYIGKTIELKGGLGLTFPGEIKGIGKSMMTVRYNFLGEWKSAEFPCSDYP